MKLYYKVASEDYRMKLNQVRDNFKMHEEIDEARTSLHLEDQSQIERVIGIFDPNQDDIGQVQVILNDETLQQYFDSIFGEPYRVKD